MLGVGHESLRAGVQRRAAFETALHLVPCLTTSNFSDQLLLQDNTSEFSFRLFWHPPFLF